ncbi:MAG TPA: thiolase family protein [Myxococcales bacterium]|nr:thiolase family protein [Myxococcales bacterium]
MRDAFILAAVRTPIGKIRGALRDVRADDLAALALAALEKRARFAPAEVEEVFLGCANQAGEDNRNVARMALLLAGWPKEVPACTVNRLCGSGLEATVQAARLVATGEAELVVAGGVESMTRAPWAMPKPSEGFPNGPQTAYDTSLGWRFPNPRMAELFPLEQMGETAENLAEKYRIPREAQDRFAWESHQKAIAAQARLAEEIVPVEVSQKKGPPVRVEKDEGPRADTTLEKLATLKGAFKQGGTVTAGNSSTLNDGAAAVLVGSAAKAKALGLEPLGRLVASASAGVDPRTMGIGPVPATRKALARAGWKLADVDLVELNEAFAAQSLACLRDLEVDPARVNVNGGAIALGHPLGCSGARILTTLVYEMRRRGVKRGLATMCIGVGQGIAALVER